MYTKPLEWAIKAAVDAGTLLTQHYGTILGAKQKESLRDIVTEIDQLSENTIVRLLQEKDPDHGILTEEKGYLGPKTDAHWVVDALDGTVNFIHNVPLFCVSVALVQNGKPMVGAIYNPLAEDLYYGAQGVGAFKNQSRLNPLIPIPLQKSLVACAFSGKAHDPKNRLNEFITFGQVNDASQGCLRTGSAAMNLAYTAEGKFGACFGKANKLWDIAAGLLLAELAGGTVTLTEVDQKRHLVSYVAGNSKAASELNPLL